MAPSLPATSIAHVTCPPPDVLFSPDLELLKHHDGNGSRYTSYPPATAFTDHFGPEQLTQALARSNATARVLSLYVHIPFCRRICFYCVGNRIATRQTAVAEPCLDRMTREMTLMRRHQDGDRACPGRLCPCPECSPTGHLAGGH